MFWLKCCPKCGGDLCEEGDHYGPYISCLQCGYYLTEAEEVLLQIVSRPRVGRLSLEAAERPGEAVGAGR